MAKRRQELEISEWNEERVALKMAADKVLEIKISGLCHSPAQNNNLAVPIPNASPTTIPNPNGSYWMPLYNDLIADRS